MLQLPAPICRKVSIPQGMELWSQFLFYGFPKLHALSSSHSDWFWASFRLNNDERTNNFLELLIILVNILNFSIFNSCQIICFRGFSLHKSYGSLLLFFRQDVRLCSSGFPCHWFIADFYCFNHRCISFLFFKKGMKLIHLFIKMCLAASYVALLASFFIQDLQSIYPLHESHCYYCFVKF